MGTVTWKGPKKDTSAQAKQRSPGEEENRRQVHQDPQEEHGVNKPVAAGRLTSPANAV